LARPRPALFALFASSLLLLPVSAAHARLSTFFESFDGGFTQAWTAAPGAFPTESLSPFRPNTVGYAGGQGVTFTKIDGANVAQLSVTNAPSWTRYGYLSVASLRGTIGEVEVRLNTLDQGVPFIDGMFDLWLVNSADHSRYVRMGLFGDHYATLRSWTYSSSLSPYSTAGDQNLPPFVFQNDTWYRLRISQLPGRPLEVSIWDDSGNTRLISHRFPHTLADLGDSFQIGFSQWMGGPNRTNSLLCAVDDIEGWLAR
jgi:hypothetical protein